MPIQITDMQPRLSGGASNNNPLLSLGGAKSSTAVGGDIFDNVSAAEAAAGRVEYRAIYIHNNHGSLTALSAKAWIDVQTPSPDTLVEIGVGTSAQGGTEQSVAAETTAPSGVTFTSPGNAAAGLALGDIPPGGHRALWIKRTVNAGAAVYADGFTIKANCETNP